MSGSLRLRLVVIILVPLLVMATAIGAWRVAGAQRTAEEVYDRSLLLAALAVAGDVAAGDGDAISFETTRLLDESAGGPLLYHVYAPDGVFQTGFAVPPVPSAGRPGTEDPIVIYDATYRGTPVRALRYRDQASIGGLTGIFTITVWQEVAVRDAFARGQALLSLALISALVGTVAVLVWFGVQVGLRPLTDLEDAISRRNPEDLNPIRRRVPIEVRGIVERLNVLFAQVTRTMEAQSAFISDAAHQLRNPLAGVRALGESIQSAPTLEDAQERSRDLTEAAIAANDLAEKLLTLERVRAAGAVPIAQSTDLVEITQAAISSAEGQARARGVRIDAELPAHPVLLKVDEVMLGEAVTNLISNALLHGGRDLSTIAVRLEEEEKTVCLTVSDDGRGVAPEDISKIRARFGQARPSPGSGLGLSIAEAVAERHGGHLVIPERERGFTARIELPQS